MSKATTDNFVQAANDGINNTDLKNPVFFYKFNVILIVFGMLYNQYMTNISYSN